MVEANRRSSSEVSSSSSAVEWVLSQSWTLVRASGGTGTLVRKLGRSPTGEDDVEDMMMNVSSPDLARLVHNYQVSIISMTLENKPVSTINHHIICLCPQYWRKNARNHKNWKWINQVPYIMISEINKNQQTQDLSQWNDQEMTSCTKVMQGRLGLWVCFIEIGSAAQQQLNW